MKLVIDNLEFSYPGAKILDRITARLEAGTLVAVVGTNGAGKTTFIKCLNRILEPRGGTVLVDGDEIHRMRRKDIAKRMAYLSQKVFHAFPTSVFEVVLTGRFPHRDWRRKHATDEAKVSDVLDLLNLSSLAFRDFNELSGGQQQKVLIARALVQESDILLLDEPVSSLDIRHQLEVMGMANHLVREHNKLVVVAIHDLNLAARYADRVIMLHEGVVFREGSPDEVFTPDTIELVYGVRVQVQKNGGYPIIIPLEPVNPILANCPAPK